MKLSADFLTASTPSSSVCLLFGRQVKLSHPPSTFVEWMGWSLSIDQIYKGKRQVQDDTPIPLTNDNLPSSTRRLNKRPNISSHAKCNLRALMKEKKNYNENVQWHYLNGKTKLTFSCWNLLTNFSDLVDSSISQIPIPSSLQKLRATRFSEIHWTLAISSSRSIVQKWNGRCSTGQELKKETFVPRSS